MSPEEAFSAPPSRERMAELLASASSGPLTQLADACLATAGPPVLIRAPEVGLVVLTVVEPVERTRFHLGEVLVTQAEVEHRGARGWSMRLGEDPAGTLAAAICDAEVAAAGPFTDRVQALCEATESALADERAREWRELAPTIVSFDELDQ